MQVDLASPLGGIVPVDPLSMKEAIRTPDDDRMLNDEDFRRKLMRSLAIADVDFTMPAGSAEIQMGRVQR